MKISNTNASAATALKVLIYGAPGAGKTSTAKTIKEPTIIISAEAGLLCLREEKIDVIDLSVDDDGKVIPKEKRIARLAEAYKYISQPEVLKKYKWVFVDSLTELSQNLIEQLELEFPDRAQSLVKYGESAKRMRGIIKSFRDLPTNVVMTALLSVEKDENNKRFYGVNMVGKISDTIAGYFDECFLLTEIEGKRVFVTEKSDNHQAKDRSGSLSKFEEPNLDLIAKKIKGVK